MGSDRVQGRGPLIVVGTLNCTVPTKMLQFKVPTNIRGPPISLFVLLPVSSPLDACCLMVVGTLNCTLSHSLSCPCLTPCLGPITPCLLMVVGTLNCSPVSLPRFRVPSTILSHSLSRPLSVLPLSHSLSRP